MEVISYEVHTELRELLAAVVVPAYVTNAKQRKRQQQAARRRAKKEREKSAARRAKMLVRAQAAAARAKLAAVAAEAIQSTSADPCEAAKGNGGAAGHGAAGRRLPVESRAARGFASSAAARVPSEAHLIPVIPRPRPSALALDAALVKRIKSLPSRHSATS